MMPPQTCVVAMIGMSAHEPAQQRQKRRLTGRRNSQSAAPNSHTPADAAAPMASDARIIRVESVQSGCPSVWRFVSSGAAAMLRLHVMNEGMNKMGLSMPWNTPRLAIASAAERPNS